MVEIFFILIQVIAIIIKYLVYILADLGWRDQLHQKNLTFICFLATELHISESSLNFGHILLSPIKTLSLNVLRKHTRAEQLSGYLPTNWRDKILCYIHSNENSDSSSESEAEMVCAKGKAKYKWKFSSRRRKVQKKKYATDAHSLVQTDPGNKPSSSGIVTTCKAIYPRLRECHSETSRDDSDSTKSKQKANEVYRKKSQLRVDSVTEKRKISEDILSEKLMQGDESASACFTTIRSAEGEGTYPNPIIARCKRRETLDGNQRDLKRLKSKPRLEMTEESIVLSVDKGNAAERDSGNERFIVRENDVGPTTLEPQITPHLDEESIAIARKSYSKETYEKITDAHSIEEQKSSLTSEHTGIEVKKDHRYQKKFYKRTHESGESTVAMSEKAATLASLTVGQAKPSELATVDGEATTSNTKMRDITLHENISRREKLQGVSSSTECMKYLSGGRVVLQELQYRSGDTTINAGSESDNSTNTTSDVIEPSVSDDSRDQNFSEDQCSSQSRELCSLRQSLYGLNFRDVANEDQENLRSWERVPSDCDVPSDWYVLSDCENISTSSSECSP